MLQQHADGHPADLGNQFALDRFFNDQTHGPARTAWRGIGTNHRDDLLALSGVQQKCRTGALPVVQRLIQAFVQVATTNLTNRFWIQSKIGAHLGSCLALVQLEESKDPNNDPNLLDSATQKLVQLVTAPLGQTNMEATIGPYDSV